MGSLFNPTNTIFYNSAARSEIYVDKTGLIDYTNRLLFDEHKNLCVSRSRRFGKSMAANMLAAYYSRGCDSKELFSGFKIACSGDFEKHLNKYNVNIIDYLYKGSIKESLDYLCRKLIYEISREYPELDCFGRNDLLCVLDTVFMRDNIPFIFIIDEWDCVFRRKKSGEDIKIYLNFLRGLPKDKSYSALAYMTGILPIKNMMLYNKCSLPRKTQKMKISENAWIFIKMALKRRKIGVFIVNEGKNQKPPMSKEIGGFLCFWGYGIFLKKYRLNLF